MFNSLYPMMSSRHIFFFKHNILLDKVTQILGWWNGYMAFPLISGLLWVSSTEQIKLVSQGTTVYTFCDNFVQWHVKYVPWFDKGWQCTTRVMKDFAHLLAPVLLWCSPCFSSISVSDPIPRASSWFVLTADNGSKRRWLNLKRLNRIAMIWTVSVSSRVSQVVRIVWALHFAALTFRIDWISK